MGWFNRGKSSQTASNSGAGTAPAGWYRDTGGSGRMRYWDGTSWTKHFAPEPTASTQPVVAAAPQVAKPPSWEQARPHGQPIPPWSDGSSPCRVVGESFHGDAFSALAASYGHNSLPSYGVEITEARAALIPDPDNPYDPNAVAVWVDARHMVGHLPREVAAQFAPRLEKLDRGTFLEVTTRVWIAKRLEWDEDDEIEIPVTRGSVRVDLPDPDGIVPYNDLPDEPHTVLPWGRAVQVLGEEHHMDALRKFGLGTAHRHVAATLHVVEEARKTTTPARVLEVRLDGERVGVLSKASSDQIHDLVTYVADRARTPVARAVIKGSYLRADVTVYVARTSEVHQKWLDSVPMP